MKCNICNSHDFSIVKYDYHTSNFNVKKFVKFFIKKIDRIIPKNFVWLKSISSRSKYGFRGNIIICKKCGYGVMNKIPSTMDLTKYYNLEYWKNRNVILPKFKKLYKKNFRAVSQFNFSINYIKKFRFSTINILDIGAAGAWSILNIRDSINYKKINLDVVEPGNVWELYYKDAKINRVASFFPFSPKKKYDYVHTSHWLEHVCNLKSTMDWFKKNINKNGLLFIEVPNTENDYWDNDIDDTPHIHFFTRDSLILLLKNYGFECLECIVLGPTYSDLQKENKTNYNENEDGVYLRAIFKNT